MAVPKGMLALLGAARPCSGQAGQGCLTLVSYLVKGVVQTACRAGQQD